MAMIRQADARTLARDAVPLDLGDLARQGEALVAAARAEAARLVALGRAERDRLVAGAAEQGRREGFAQGLEEGRRAGREEGRAAALEESRARLSELDAAWTRALEEFSGVRDRLLSEARRDVLELAIRLAGMVTKRAIAAEPASVADQLEAVLGVLARPTRLVIEVNPDDLPLVMEALPTLAERYRLATHVETVGEASLSRGSVVARLPSGGSIDATIETQLERIAASLLGRTA